MAASLIPRRLRVVHLVVIPALGMVVTIILSRLSDRFLLPTLPPLEGEIYGAIRTVLIALLMASLIGFLAFRYRGEFEVELRARNEDLEATRDFLQRIIVGSAEAIITRDVAGLVTSWNPAAEAIYGWSAKEMLQQPTDLLVPDDPFAQAEREKMEAALARGETVRAFEANRIRKDGKRITVAITMSPIYDRSGSFAGTAGIVRDVTSLKEMEARLVEKETLAAAGEMAATMAHEVRNPLAGIRGGCEILLEGYPDGDPRNEIGREVIHQVDRLNRTVQDMLLFARPKAMDPVPIDLRELLNRLVSVLRDDPDNKAVLIERRYDGEAPVARVDARQMEQVFLNLLLNACQAMGHRGRITIGARTSEATVEVFVEDEGPGIPPERLDQIFKPFFTTKSQGTGLGLAICKRIVAAHGGAIEVSAPEGGGARLAVILPRGEVRIS